ncbi:hypothetical protein AO1008_01829 [Aspergillus oryzae 100-8]|uniref:F-box domain-containing protein n=1 Tax=Aspergillus oryzae (strain 3.042) TaxID=1160506 RepID=I8IT74_ASPO3|nr:hypothetical protein Ao3042_00216 [Aspergillus oryzae 3.042]KDE76148.1 hypothetical protein AO1008_01829 [Aspergillus oryzae 100-8]|eukprot:EIT82636.1 hypothetical protein Ao3042_00216 [Aspergillus oryzae 3.042]
MELDSTTKALSLWEILHPILLNLDMRTLLHAQRVCRVWYHIITRSRSLQQALFFLPVEESQATGPVKRIDQINPLLKEILWPQLSWLATSARKLKSSERRRQAKERGIPTLRSETASWRRMLIRQPPPITIGIQGEDEDDANSPAPTIYYNEDISTECLWVLTEISTFADHCFVQCIFSGDDGWKEIYPPEQVDLVSEQDLQKCDMLLVGYCPPNYLLRMIQWILRYAYYDPRLSLRVDIHPPMLDFYYLMDGWVFVIANHHGPIWTYNVDDMALGKAPILESYMHKTQLNPLTEQEATAVKHIVDDGSLARTVGSTTSYTDRLVRVIAKLVDKGILPKFTLEEHEIIYRILDLIHVQGHATQCQA